jgi:hypothetical protein
MPLSPAQWEDVRLAYAADLETVDDILAHYKIKRHELDKRRISGKWPSRAARGLRFGRRNSNASTSSEQAPSVDRDQDAIALSEPIERPEIAPTKAKKAKHQSTRPHKSSHRELLQVLNNLLQIEIEKMDENDVEDPVRTERLKTIDHCFKLLERSHAMSNETANTKPDQPNQRTGKQRADQASKLRREIADRLERLQDQRRAPAKSEPTADVPDRSHS